MPGGFGLTAEAAFFMDTHQKDQLDAFGMVVPHLGQIGRQGIDRIRALVADYLSFRQETSRFSRTHFADVCARTCYQTRLSACCTRDGIIVHFADVVVNTLVAPPEQTQAIVRRLIRPPDGNKCIYLGAQGCLWTLKPIGCEMFFCDPARHLVFDANPHLHQQWVALETRRKSFTWPDRPVLFDELEAVFGEAGVDSPLMYFHKSPGLLRVKRNAGLI